MKRTIEIEGGKTAPDQVYTVRFLVDGKTTAIRKYRPDLSDLSSTIDEFLIHGEVCPSDF